MQTKNILIIIVSLFVLIGGGYLFAQSSSNSQNTSVGVGENNENMNQNVNTTDKESVKTFEIEGKPFEFSQKEIKVKKGERVKIIFKNTEGFHDLVIDEFNAKTKQIKTGETDTIEFVADKQGTFEFHCSVPGHKEKGMEGMLIVE